MTLLRSTVPADSQSLLAAIERRSTDRRRFTSWPIPDERLGHLAARAGEWGVRALPLVAVTERFLTELLVNRAADRQRADKRVEREQWDWIDRSAVDGIPSRVLPAPNQLAARRPSRFSIGLLGEPDTDVDSSDGLIVLCTREDATNAWLRTGEGLSALWLAATSQGLSIVPLSQVVEVTESRRALQHEVLGSAVHPQIMVRVGWQPISRSELPQTSRRPVSDILELA